MTRYRTIHDGYCKWLEYEKETNHSFLGIKWTSKKWENVPKPYYDKIRGRYYVFKGWDVFITSYNTNIENFTKTYPDIEKYWPIYEKEQLILEEESKDYWQEKNKLDGKIEYL